MIKLAIIPLFCPQPLVLASFSSVLMAVLQRSTGLSLSSELGTKLPLLKLQDFQDHKLKLKYNIACILEIA
jgi:hypothetical protein